MPLLGLMLGMLGILVIAIGAFAATKRIWIGFAITGVALFGTALYVLL